MNENIAELLERMRTDEEFKKRVQERRERERTRLRPLWRKHIEAYQKRDTNRQKQRAREAVRQAVYNGWIKPELCAVRDEHCRGRLETHHWHGYDDAHALDIQWLCRYHHKVADATKTN